MPFESGFHGVFFTELNICKLAFASIERGREGYSRNLHNVRTKRQPFYSIDALQGATSLNQNTHPTLCLTEKVPQFRLACWGW